MTHETKKLTIRPGTIRDAEACYIAHREATLIAYAHIFPREQYPFPDQAMRERWREDCLEGKVLVAEQENKVIGTAGFDATDFVSFFVIPQYWGSGVAGGSVRCGDDSSKGARRPSHVALGPGG